MRSRSRRPPPPQYRITRRSLSSRAIPDTAETAIHPVRLNGVSTWGCQFQGESGRNLAVSTIRDFSGDLIIIDYSADASASGAFDAHAVDAMRHRPGDGNKKLIAYMSIGEAEVGRFYWELAWTKRKKEMRNAPAWLHAPSVWGWEGNWIVNFWDAAWQNIIVDAPGSYLNRIIDAGFDGVFLDVVDVAGYWEEEVRGPVRHRHALEDMVAFVTKISRHARIKRGQSNFLVIPNGTLLLKSEPYRSVISAVVIEDVIYDQAAQANDAPRLVKRPLEGDGSIAEIAAQLNPAIGDKLLVLAIDYLMDRPEDREKIPAAAAAMTALYPYLAPYFTVRKLDRLCPPFGPAIS